MYTYKIYTGLYNAGSYIYTEWMAGCVNNDNWLPFPPKHIGGETQQENRNSRFDAFFSLIAGTFEKKKLAHKLSPIFFF